MTKHSLSRLRLGSRLRAWCTAFFVVAALGACTENKVQATARGPVPVAIESAQLATVPLELSVIGNVMPIATISVKSRVDGQIQRVFFTEGQDVKRGEALFQIDARPYRVALAQARANLARDEVQAKNAASEEQRASELVKTKLISQQEYDQKSTQLGALRAALLADQAMVDNAQVNLDYTSISSPIAGRTGTLQITAGNLVKANTDPPLVVIRQISPIFVAFAAPADRLSEIRRFSAEGALKVQVEVPGGGDTPPLDGTLSFIDNAVDLPTGTIGLKATFANEDRALWPGQFARVDILLTKLAGAVVVPARAVQPSQQGELAFVVSQTGTAEARQVKTGARFGEQVVIERGIAAGERVVTDGQLNLVSGATVEIKPQTERPEGARK